MINGKLEDFYERCATEGGITPLRTRCQHCCNGNNNAVIRKCAKLEDNIHNDIHDCDENELYIKNECVCGTQLCNRECHCHSNGDEIECYKCNANDPWCGNVDDLEDHGSSAQTKCSSSKCKMIGKHSSEHATKAQSSKHLLLEYKCGNFHDPDVDCRKKYNNALLIGNLDAFYKECATENGLIPLRMRCPLCCSDENHHLSAYRNCANNNEQINDEIHGCDEDELYVKNECVCSKHLCNKICSADCNGSGAYATPRSFFYLTFVLYSLFMN